MANIEVAMRRAAKAVAAARPTVLVFRFCMVMTEPVRSRRQSSAICRLLRGFVSWNGRQDRPKNSQPDAQRAREASGQENSFSRARHHCREAVRDGLKGKDEVSRRLEALLSLLLQAVRTDAIELGRKPRIQAA